MSTGTNDAVMNGKPRENALILLAALACLFSIHFLTVPACIASAAGVSLTPAGKSAIGVLVFALILWVTEAMPFHMTGLLSIFLLSLLKVDSFLNIVRFGFGSHIAVFMLGVLTLSAFLS